MIYPYTPFIAEEIYLNLPQHLGSIMLEKYPTYNNDLVDESISNQVDLLFSIIRDVRNYKIENKLAPNAQLDFSIKLKTPVFQGFETYLKRFSFAKEIIFTENEIEKKGQLYVYDIAEIVISSDVKTEEVVARIQKEIEAVKSEILRCEKMLSNPNFINKAPEQKVAVEREKLQQHQTNLKTLEEKLDNLTK